MFSIQFRKNITVKDNEKRFNIANFYIQIYIYIYTCLICDDNDSKQKYSKNSILQHGRVIDKNCCVAFPTSGFPYLILCPRQYKWAVATTYLDIRTEDN